MKFVQPSYYWVATATAVLAKLIVFSEAVDGAGMFLYQDDSNPDAKAVIEVTDATSGFFETSKKNRIVEFYSPFCGACVNFKPKYIKVAAEARAKYNSNGESIEFYGVSCAGVPDLCQRYSINSYPSVFAIAAGASVDERKSVGGSLFFSLKKVEKALKLNPAAAAAAHLDSASSTNRQLGHENDGDDEQEEEVAAPEEEEKEEEEEEEVNGQIPGVNDGEDEEEKHETDGGDDGDDSPDAEFNQWASSSSHAVVPEKKDNKRPDAAAAGADLARNKPHTMDQWNEIQKKRIREKEKTLWLSKRKKAKPPAVITTNGSRGTELNNNSNPGATPIMLANRRGTAEFDERQEDMFKVIDRVRPSRQRRNDAAGVALKKRMKAGQLPFKKKLPAPRFIERVPIIKRVASMTSEEELILDASLSFLEGLRVGVYKSVDPLSPKQKRALKDWLDLLSIALPPEWALHETIVDLVDNIDLISQSYQNLTAIMERHPFPRTKWSKSCGRNSGFTCGFWKLLHIMTVGVAEHRGGRDMIDAGTLRPTARVFSPREAADALREYMAHFFPCTECAAHFVAHYDQCEMNRRCDRLTGDAAAATDADWKELAKWLWEVHNGVSVGLLNQRLDDKRKKQQRSAVFKASAGPGGATMAEQVQVLWPTLDGCVVCFSEDGSFNEEEVFLHLERTYWPGYDLKDTPRKLIWFEDDGQGAVGLNSILFVIGLLAVLILRNRVARASVAQTVLKARTMGTRVAAGGKIRTI